MRASTAYFVGAGTIVAALAIGLGGGIVAGNIMNPVAPKQTAESGQHERRVAAATPTGANTTPSDRVHYLTGSQAFGALVAASAAAQEEAKPDVKPAAAAVQASAEAAPPASAATATKPVEQAAAPPASPDNAFANARDADVKRSASERRRADRRERWAERRRHEPRAARTDWNDVARNVRADSEDRDFARPPRSGGPQIMLFGSDDD